MAKEVIRVQQEDTAPFFWTGDNNTGVLLLHGFSGTPREMSRIGTYLKDYGYTIYAPLLPGHGTTLDAINKQHWHDWTAASMSAFDRLAHTCEHVFIGGFSMGSLLTLWLAIQHVPSNGIILYSPALKIADWRIALTPILRTFIKRIASSKESDLRDLRAEDLLGGYSHYPVPAAAELYKLRRRINRTLHRITTPACVIYAVHDHSIHPRSGPLTVQRLSRYVPVETMVLHDSGHAIVVDQEWEIVAKQTLTFIQRYSS